MLDIVFYLLEIACLLQIVSKFITWRRLHTHTTLFVGIPAFVVLLVAFALAQIRLGDDPVVTQRFLITTTRLMFLLTGVLWIIEGAISIATYVKVPENHPVNTTTGQVLPALAEQLREHPP